MIEPATIVPPIKAQTVLTNNKGRLLPYNNLQKNGANTIRAKVLTKVIGTEQITTAKIIIIEHKASFKIF